MYQHSSSTCIWSIYISQLIRYARAWGTRYARAWGPYQDFLDIGMLLTMKLLNQGFLLVKLKSSLRKFYGRHHDLVDRYGICVTNDHGYVPLVVYTSRSFPRSWLITGFVIILTRRVSLVEQELPTFPEHRSSPRIFSGVRVTRSLVLYECFVDHGLSFCTFSFGRHCVVCSSSIYGFWLSLWHLQTLLTLYIMWSSALRKANIRHIIWICLHDVLILKFCNRNYVLTKLYDWRLNNKELWYSKFSLLQKL